MIIAEDFMKNPQKIFFKISYSCLILASYATFIVNAFLCKFYVNHIQDYLPFFNEFNLYFIGTFDIILTLLLIIALCCWKSNIYAQIMKKPLRRFFAFVFMVPPNIATFAIGFSFFTGNIEGLNIKNADNFNYIYIALLSFQGFSMFLLLISYVIMFMNLSDKEIREAQCRNNYDVDYFRPPQKYFFLISMIGIVVATFAELIIAAYLYALLIKYKTENKKTFKYLDRYYPNYMASIFPFTIGCNNEKIMCEEHNYNFSNENFCYNSYTCPFVDTEFYYFTKCGYLYNFIYNCTYDFTGEYSCYEAAKCDEIEQFNFANNCSDLDECYKYNSSFIYLGYCNYQKNFIYNCTSDIRYYNWDIFGHFYKCYEVDNCSEIDKYWDKLICQYWGNCSDLNNFYYSGYCDDNNYTDYIYKCVQKVVYYDDGLELNDVLSIVIIIVGCLQFIIIIALVIAKICIKGSLFRKLLEISFVRYLFYFIPFFIHILGIVVEFVAVYRFYNVSKNHKMEAHFMLAFDLVQVVSLVLFILGIVFVNINKSDLEIVENTSALSITLVQKE